MCRPERLLEYVLRLVLERIAAGRGTSVQDVNQLLRQYAQMAKMFEQMGKGGGLAKAMMRGGLSGLGAGRKAAVREVELLRRG